MVIFSNCKINIGLNILNRREDGYHNLQTLFYPLPLYDVLELIPSKQTQLTIYGIQIPGNHEDNIILRAYRLIKKDFPKLPNAHFYLLKNIPPGTGLGAGSANGAYTLLLLNNYFCLQLTQQKLLHYAAQLGSDCSFFIFNEPSLASGRGEMLSPANIDLSNYTLLIVNPGIHISTPHAFQHLRLRSQAPSLAEAIQQPIPIWQKTITNDFEEWVFAEYPAIASLKKELYNAGALYCAMSGTGSTVYGIFEKGQSPRVDFPKNYFYKSIIL